MMKTLTLGGWLLALTLTAGAKMPVPADPATPVQVCVEYDSRPLVVQSAQKLATRLFADAGVTVRWQSGFRGCPETAIRVKLTEHTPIQFHPGALAYANCYTAPSRAQLSQGRLPQEKSHIYVFADRIASSEPGEGMPHLLAHVLAHEITHMLQAVVRHSETGLMRPHWSPEDQATMRRTLLAWDPVDIELIHAGLAIR